MNRVILSGRLANDPDVKYSGELAITRYTIAVPRQFKRDGENGTDFIRCVAFGEKGKFAEKYFNKGKRVEVDGRIQTGSYENKKGEKVYTTEIIVENQFFGESKSEERVIPQAPPKDEPEPSTNDGFMRIPDDSGLPFNF